MNKYLLTCAILALGVVSARAQSLDALQEQAIKKALAKIGPSVVAIETQGGADTIVVAGPRGQRNIRKGLGPTTGLIVSQDGFVITSAFNFANKPTNILVTVPGHKDRYVAKVVSTDKTRMLTLLQLLNFDGKNVTLPTPLPKAEVKVGMTALAVGRTLALNVEELPSVSQGIVSAVERIWGKAIQSDAKISPANYGGPLIDLTGRVMGVLVPADPRAEGETAGLGWYDSGIGFAMPLDDILRVLPRMKDGKDLGKGVLGVTFRSADMFGDPPIINTVAPGSAAEAAGLKPGDRIVKIDGKVVNNFAQVRHQLESKYDGDVISLEIQRDMATITIKELKLGSAVAAFNQPFLGILPMRDDAEAGIEVRHVFPRSPAAEAGIKAGDRLTKFGPNEMALRPLNSRAELSAALGAVRPGTKVTFEIVPAGAKDAKEAKKVAVTVGDYMDIVPDKLPEKASKGQALVPKKTGGPAPMPMPMPKPEDKKDDKKDDKKEDKKEDKKDEKPKAPTGFMDRSNAARDRKYWMYVPENYDPNYSYAVLVWLHPVGKNKESDMEKVKNLWEDVCTDQRVILVAPVSENETGWAATESDFVLEATKAVMGQYTVDRQRVIAHGMGAGGQMAFYLAFAARDIIRGVATTGAVLNSNPKERVPNQPLSFLMYVGEKDPILEAVRNSKAKLAEHRYPVLLRELKEKGHQYFDPFDETLSEAFKDMARWIDSLDRL